MRRERVLFELGIIYDRLNEIKPEYEAHKSSRQEHITDIKISKRRPFIVIHMNTYAFKIARAEDDEAYEISWYREIEDDKFTKDGSSRSEDLARVIRDMEAYLYGSFCPARSGWWVDHQRPKHYTRNQRWA